MWKGPISDYELSYAMCGWQQSVRGGQPEWTEPYRAPANAVGSRPGISAWRISLGRFRLTARRTVSIDIALALPPTLRSVLYWYTRVANFGMFDWTTDDTIGMGWQNFDQPNTPSDTL
jgi:hypothetical protein